MYSDIWQFEPLLPSRSLDLRTAAEGLRRYDSEFAAALGPQGKVAIVRAVEIANACYSSRMEGYPVSPTDVVSGLQGEFSEDLQTAFNQRIGVAHVLAERLAFALVCSDESMDMALFARACHEVFYNAIPAPLRLTSDDEKVVVPGAWREDNRYVGRHLAPAWQSVPRFMERIGKVYSRPDPNPVQRLTDIAAAHHRLAWVHPFVDGNGRVARIVSSALLYRDGVNQHRCWSLQAALARSLGGGTVGEEYRAAMANADQPRMGSLDGRGNLSAKLLDRFCKFFLECASSEVVRMSQCIADNKMLLKGSDGAGNAIMPVVLTLFPGLRAAAG